MIALAIWGAVALSEAGEVVDRILAVVNDEAISLRDFMEYYKPYAEKIAVMDYPAATARDLEKKLRKEKLDQMIDERLARQEIRRMNLRVSETEIDGAIAQIRRMNGVSEAEFESALQSENLTMAEYRKRMEEQILRAKLINQEVKSKIVITESDVKEYYEKHLNEFEGKETVRLRNIVIPVSDPSDEAQRKAAKDRIQKVYAKLKAGVSFEALAREYTVASLADSGGDLGWFERSALSSQIQAALAPLEPGQSTDILETEKGFQVFQIQDIKREAPKSMESVFDQIQKKLYDGVVETRFKAWLVDLRSRAYIRLMDD